MSDFTDDDVQRLVAIRVARGGFEPGDLAPEHLATLTLAAEIDLRAVAPAIAAREWDLAHDAFCPRGKVCSTHLKPGDRIYFRDAVDGIPVIPAQPNETMISRADAQHGRE